MATTTRARKTTATRKPATRKPTAAQTAAADAKKAAATEARQAKVTAMAAVEEFDIDDSPAYVQRAFDDLCTHYSEGNAMLILAQAAALGLKVRGLRDVGGFNTMQERGRAIVKGQHQVFFIWGKKVERKNADENAPAETAPAPANESETARKARSFYPIVGLFHVSQTEDLAKAKARWAAEKAAAK